MSYPNIEEQVSHFFSGLAKNWKIKLVTKPESLECSLFKNNRTVCLKWFKSSPKEFWFSMHEGSRRDLIDWTEMFEDEQTEALFEYLNKITTRYLESEIRVIKKWLFWGPKELQYLKGEKWCDLRSPV